MKKKLTIFSSIAAISLLLFIIIALIVNNDINVPTKFDTSVRDFFYDIRGEKGGFLYYFCRIITEIGSQYFVIIIGVLLVIYTKLDHRAFAFAIGALLMILINYVFKDIYQRERPLEEFRWIAENDFSFPSGHSTATGFTFTFLAYFIFDSDFKKPIKITGYVICGLLFVLVPMTRLVFGVHYITDILAGLLNGIFAASIAIILIIIFKQFKIFDEPLFSILYKYIKDKRKNKIGLEDEEEK